MKEHENSMNAFLISCEVLQEKGPNHKPRGRLHPICDSTTYVHDEEEIVMGIDS